MVWIKAFLAGFLATLVFHQGLFAVFYALGAVPSPPFNLSPVPPFGVPAVLSLAFFGGLWGVPLWAMVRQLPGRALWAGALSFGAIAPTMVAMLVVFPLRDQSVELQTWVGGFLLNGAWGVGVAVFMRFFGARRV